MEPSGWRGRCDGQPKSGKGDALVAHFHVASGDVIVTLDADGSQKVDESPLFVGALRNGPDFAKGSRLVDGGGSAGLPWLRAAAHGTSYTDLTGYNAFWRHCLPDIVTDADGFEGEAIMCIRAARDGLRIAAVPLLRGAPHLRREQLAHVPRRLADPARARERACRALRSGRNRLQGLLRARHV